MKRYGYIYVAIRVGHCFSESTISQLLCQDKIYSLIEMQQYIDISPYHDTLGSDTVSIHMYLGRYQYIEYRDILMYRHQNVYLYCSCRIWL